MKAIREGSRASFHYVEIDDDDVTPTERPIAATAKKAYKYVAVVGGGLIVLFLFLFLSMRVATVVLMPAMVVVQTSFLHGEDRLSTLDTQAMAERGFDVGMLAFGNTECNKLMKAITFETMQKCQPPLPEETSKVTVDRGTKYQKIIGFGGAFTEAAAINFYKLPEIVQDRVVALYWGEDGIKYTLGRVPINSCDFSPESYSFDNIEGDTELTYFDTELTHDNAFMMPLMRLAQEEAQKWGGEVKLVASPWSPPKWMKEPVKGVQAMNGSAEPLGLIDTDGIKKTWATYISKWVQSYTSKGVPIWAVTPQNEPEFAAPWEACKWTADAERDWIKDYLGPILKHYNPDLKILAFDHNKDHLLDWADTILGDKDAAKYVDGMAFHWYAGGLDRMLDGTYGYNRVNSTHHAYPDSILINTEGCSCPGVSIDDWQRAERHGHDVIFDMLNHANGWIDWNLLVNSEGGINHVGNNCDAPLVCLEDFSDVHLQPKYFYMGHFSRYVTPGSRRVESSVVGKFGFDPSLDTGARAGMEVQAWPCEESTRQQWKLEDAHGNEESTIILDQPLSWVAEDGKKMSTHLCFGGTKGWMPDRPYISLVNCDPNDPTYEDHMPLEFVVDQHHRFLVEMSSGKCLGLAEGVREAGALLELQECIVMTNSRHESKEEGTQRDHQQFHHDAETGEIKLSTGFAGEMCLTSGWPFLTGVAFESEDLGTATVVVMNEASQDTKITLTDSVKGTGWFGINGRSMQTIIY